MLKPMFLDFETFSAAGYDFIDGKYKGKGIETCGSAVYSEHPSTEVLSVSYGFEDGPVYFHKPVNNTFLIPSIFEHFNSGGMFEAHNWIFEYFIWINQCCRKYGWPVITPDRFVCTAAQARAFGYPGGLDKLGKVIRDKVVKKLEFGKDLIKKLCIPQNPTKKDPVYRRLPTDPKYSEEFQDLYKYNIGDVKAEISVSQFLPPMSSYDMQQFRVDQDINTRGVKIDLETVKLFDKIVTAVVAEANQELFNICGLTVSQNVALAEWCGMNSVDKGSVEEALKNDSLSPQVRRVLEIKQLVGGTSVTKLKAMQAQICSDGRIRDMYCLNGALRTKRYSGRGVQPQNLMSSGPSTKMCPHCKQYFSAVYFSCPWCGTFTDSKPVEWGIELIEQFIRDAGTLSLDDLKRVWVNVVDAVGGSLRGLFISEEGYDLISSDDSAIEAVVLSMLANETWRIEVFQTHGKIYEASASELFNVPLQEFFDHKAQTGSHHPLRKKGKVSELASGYGGWIGAYKRFGAEGTDEEIKELVVNWRDRSPRIVELWGGQYRKHPDKWEFTPELYGVEGAVIKCLLGHGPQKISYVEYRYDPAHDVMICTLPSGQELYYHQPRLEQTTFRMNHELPAYKITYWGWNSDSNKGPIGWIKQDTYGGKLVENITQAIAGDIFKFQIRTLNSNGYPIVLHTHDEGTGEVPEGFGSVEEFEALMMILPEWCKDWPIRAAGGWRGKRYRK